MADKKSSVLNEQAVQRMVSGLTTLEDEKKFTKGEADYIAKVQEKNEMFKPVLAIHTREKVLTATEAKGIRSASIDLDVDISEALKGLKALQRETKKATQSIHDFANFLNNNEQAAPMLLSAFSNDDLINALKERGIEVVK